MKRFACALLLAVALPVAAQSPMKPGRSDLDLQIAEKNLQIAHLTQELHQAQRLAQSCSAAFNAAFAAQDKQDAEAVNAAQAAVGAARAAAVGKPAAKR